MNDQNLQHLIESISQSARKASLELTALTSEKKNQFLYDLADALEASIEGILEANAVDIDNAKSMDLSPPMIERLQFTKDSINQMAVGVPLTDHSVEPPATRCCHTSLPLATWKHRNVAPGIQPFITTRSLAGLG